MAPQANLHRGYDSMHRSIALVCATVLVTSAATATAASLITGKDVQDGSLTGKDIKNGSVTNGDLKKGSIALNRLSKGAQKRIADGLSSPSPSLQPNAPAAQAEAGAKGDKGEK